MTRSRTSYSLVLTLLIVLSIVLTPSVSAAFKYLNEGMDVPEVAGKEIRSGESIGVDELYRQGIVVVVFWATWSPRSIDELRDLNELATRLDTSAFQILAVNVDAQELSPARRTAIDNVVADINPVFPVILDDGLEIFYRFGVIAVPSTAVVDTLGVLRYAPSGYSLSVADFLVDTIVSYLGLRDAADTVPLPERYNPTKTASRYYHLALRLYHKGAFEQALDNLEKARAEDSLFASVSSLCGEIALRLDEPDEAVEHYRQAARLDSNSVSARAGLGKALLISGAHEQAKAALERAIQIEDTYTPALLDYALCLAEEGNTAAALDSLSDAVELNPNDFLIYYYLGHVYHSAEQPGKALEAYERALSILYPHDR